MKSNHDTYWLKLLLSIILMVTVTYPCFSQPAISSFSPVSGSTGSEGSTTITILGSGFDATPSNNLVFFGAVYAVPSAASTTSLTVTVPAGATYEYLTVLNKTTNLRATDYLHQPFTPTFYNEGALQFSNSTDYTLSYTSSKPYFKIGDIDGDGKPDVVLLNVADNTVSVLRNTSSPGSISFATNVDIATGTTPTCIVIDDIDGDGKPDLVVGSSADKNFSVMLNTSSTGSISFAAKVDFTSSTATSIDEIASGDLDGDGKTDLTTLRINGSSSLVYFFLNTSTVGSVSFSSTGADPENTPKNIVISDFDQDGKPDYAIQSYGTATGYIFRNTKSLGSSSTLISSYSFAIGTGSAWIAAGDLDGDGKPDLVSTNTGGFNIVTLKNTSTIGSISLAAKDGHTVSTTPSCVVISDIDGDGKPDIAASGKGNSTINIFRNNSTAGTIALGARVTLSTISSPDFLAFCDFDGDGKPDMAVVNSSSFTITKSIAKTNMFISRMPF